MNSAFGVDHGSEISKVKVMWGGAGDKTTRMGLKNGAGKLKRLPKAVGEASVSINGIGRAGARGVKAAGDGASRVANKYPGLTGGAVVGTAGYGTYKAAEKRGAKKKKG